MNLTWGGPGYNAYEVVMKVSQAEKDAQAQSAQESKYLQNMMQVQFKEQQDLLNNVLLPQLKQMATNPQGFGAKALADMQSKLISTVGSQFASQEKGLQERFATKNLPGVGSGVQEALRANLAQGAAGEEAGGLLNIDLANEQLKEQQRMAGISGLAGASTLLGQAPGSAGLSLQANQQRFDQSYKMAQQGSLWQNLLGGVIGAGLNFASGGLTGLLGGGGGMDQSMGGA
jgi:hypothetical protein